MLPGLQAAVGGAGGAARVDWVALPAGSTLELALFRGPSAGVDRAGDPIAELLTGTAAVLAGQPQDVDSFYGLAARQPPELAWQPVGAVLRARASAPIFVNPAADPAGATGTSPESAFPSLFLALLTAASQGGGNVWVSGGELLESGLPLLPGVFLSGGFPGDFDLAARDPEAHPSVLRAAPNSTGLAVQGGLQGAVVDGLLLDGGGEANVGLDLEETPLELRRTRVTGFTSRGVRVRAAEDGDALPILLVGCTLSANGGDGLSASGSLDFTVEACRFEDNVQEGADFADLVAPEGRTVSLAVRDSLFRGNGTEGLDVDLAPPPFPGLPGGHFEVAIRGSRFEENGADGLLLDHDFEQAPAWSADVAVVGCTARANAAAGLHLDVDGAGPVFVHRVACGGNGGPGLLLSSESLPGLVVVSASVFAGNLEEGVRGEFGQRAFLLSHCALAGNAGGGARSEEVLSAASSTALWLQGGPWSGVAHVASVAAADPTVALFEVVPRHYAQAVAQSGAELETQADLDVLPGSLVEVADDGVERTPTVLGPDRVSLEPAPAGLSLPALLTLFPAGSGVEEDYRLPFGSPAAGAGLVPPGAPAVDAGPWGAPLPGPPGRDDPLPGALFRLGAVEPPLGVGPAAGDPLELVFEGGIPDPGALGPGDVRAVDSAGQELFIGIELQGARILVHPPPGGWGADVWLELHGSLRAIGGAPLAAPVAFRFSAG